MIQKSDSDAYSLYNKRRASYSVSVAQVNEHDVILFSTPPLFIIDNEAYLFSSFFFLSQARGKEERESEREGPPRSNEKGKKLGGGEEAA